jgi:peptidoglycan/xylan/chitin deacetylase (PgdA/CDA1 family)
MPRKRDLLSNVLDYSGITTLASYYKKRIKNEWLTILAYHRVINHCPGIPFDFDEDLISATVEDFEVQVKWLRENFDIISFDSLAKRKNVSNSLIITFDDGYKDNYKSAYPILKKYSVPATIFLSTGFIGANGLFWWDEISYLIKKTAKKKFILELKGHREFRLTSEKDKKFAINSLLVLVKRVSNTEKNKIIKQLSEKLDVGIDGSVASGLILNWNEVKEMSEKGIEFGAHSVSHPVLSNVSSEMLRYEIEESKNTIERETGKNAIVFSYPVGGESSFDERTKQLLKQTNYSYAVTYVHGVNRRACFDNYLLKRIHVEKEDNIALFKSKIIFPNLIRH